MSLRKGILKFFTDIDGNIFGNYKDALLGCVILIVLPLLSVISTFNTMNQPQFFSYLFPILSICAAGAYDTYGRYGKNSIKNAKLYIRLACDCIALIIATVVTILRQIKLTVVAPILLVVPGVLILYEVVFRVVTAIQIRRL